MGIIRTQGLGRAPDAEAAGLEDHRRGRSLGQELRRVAAVFASEAIGDVLGYLRRSPFVVPEVFRVEADPGRGIASAQARGTTCGSKRRADAACTRVSRNRHGEYIGECWARL